MEGGKRGEEAGSSSGGGSSSASAAASGVVGDQRQEKQKEMSEKPSQVCGVVEEGDEEEEEDVKDEGVVDGFVPGPLLSLKEQIEKDKDDDSLRRWKEKLLGCLENDLNGQMEPEVKFHSLAIISDATYIRPRISFFYKHIIPKILLVANARFPFSNHEILRWEFKIVFKIAAFDS